MSAIDLLMIVLLLIISIPIFGAYAYVFHFTQLLASKHFLSHMNWSRKHGTR